MTLQDEIASLKVEILTKKTHAERSFCLAKYARAVESYVELVKQKDREKIVSSPVGNNRQTLIGEFGNG